MDIQHRQEGKRGAFFIKENEVVIAELTYGMTNPDTMLISHTGVSPRLRGRGIAMKLVEAAVNFARENNFKVIPQCSYVRWAFEVKPELSDVMKRLGS